MSNNTYTRQIIPWGNSFTLYIHLDRFEDGQYEDFDLSQAKSIKVALVCATHNTVIDLDYTIVSGNCLSCFVDYRLLHTNTSYGVVVEGYDENDIHWRWYMLPKEGILVIPNTSGMKVTEDVQTVDLQGRVGWGIEATIHADWAEEDPEEPSYIENKPDLSIYATAAELDGKQDTLVSGENIKTINNQSILGEGNITIEQATQVQANWNETDTTSPAYIQNKPDMDDYQEKLVSGENIKTINNQSILGSGNITIQGGGGSSEDTDTLAEASIKQVQELEQGMTQLQVDIDKSITDLETAVDNKLEEASKEAEDKALVTAEALNDLKANTQEQLVSGENIKTINNISILGSGNIDIQGGGGTQVQANWNESDTTSPAYIQNKPNMNDYVTTSSLASVATSGNYNDLNNKPTIPASPVKSNWNESDSSSLAYIQNKPTIPASPVQSDWNESDSSSLAYIQNKPTITTPDPSTGNAGQVLATNGTNYYFRNETEAMLISTSSGSTQTKRMSSSNIASLSMLQNKYFTVIISTDNTYVGEIKLRLYTDNTDTSGHTIYINGAVSSSTNYTLPKGSYTVYYDGTYYYFDTTGQIPFVPKSSTYDMKIEVVNAMPQSPDSNTLYIVL